MWSPDLLVPAGAIPRAAARASLRRLLPAILVALASPPPLSAAVKVGDVFPPLAAAKLVPLAGAELPALAGKVVLVDFWASWCAPCKAAFPALAQLHADFSARGLVVVAVGVDEKPAPAAAFAKKLAPPFSTLHDREQKLVGQVAVPAMPTTYLLGRDGRVRFVHEGFHGDRTVAELLRHIETLLAEKTTP